MPSSSSIIDEKIVEFLERSEKRLSLLNSSLKRSKEYERMFEVVHNSQLVRARDQTSHRHMQGCQVQNNFKRTFFRHLYKAKKWPNGYTISLLKGQFGLFGLLEGQMATLATYASGHIKFVERYRLENLWEDRDERKQEGKEKAMEREREQRKANSLK